MSSLYDTIGTRYGVYRRPDPTLARAIHAELSQAAAIVNLGAGVGSYEPVDRDVIAVEPSRLMISKRPRDAHPALQGRAESLPFKDNAFDVAMAVLSLHHWSDIERGLVEARRVARYKVVLLTWVGFGEHFWLLDYLPQIREVDEPLFPSIEELARILGPLRVVPLPIPHDCTDGFLCAYWRRPHAYLDEGARSAISTFSRITDFEEGLRRLEKDLQSGEWKRRHHALFQSESLDCGYRLVVAESKAASGRGVLGPSPGRGR